MSTNPSESRHFRPALERWIAGALASISFAIHLLIALQFDATGSFDQQDVFFHADTQSRLECTSVGKCAGRSTIAHPSLALFVNPPVRAIAILLSRFANPEVDLSELRRRTAIFLSPAAAGLRAAVAFFFFRSLGLARFAASIASLLGIVSFSGLVFGSLPESFALSDLLITAAFLLAARPRPGIPPQWAKWFVLGVLATGITVTNLVYIAILFTAARVNAGDDWRRGSLRCLSLMAAISAASLLLAIASHGLYESRPLEPSEGLRYIETWTRDNDPGTRAREFPTALANSIVSMNPVPRHNYQAELHAARYKFRFSFEGRPGVFSVERPFATLLLLLAVAGAFSMWHAEPPARNAAAAAGAIVFFNFVLHSFWGVEVFLYSQHWLHAFSLLTVGVLFLPKRFETAALLFVSVFTIAIAANNYQIGRLMLEYFAVGV